MAEQVQAALDQMVPALRDLMDKGVFSESETKFIIKRRRESEYLLRRRIARKSDFMQYIEAERKLERLRSLRSKKLIAIRAKREREEDETNNKKRHSNQKKKKWSTFGDVSIVQLIHLIFVRAKRKWGGDLSWHLQHAEFAKEARSFQMLGKIYAEALQKHPKNYSLWIEAASYEFFGPDVDNRGTSQPLGGSIQNARVLLQRGLRINKTSEDLWLQSLCLELHYIQKLQGRREILQLDEGKNGEENVSDKEGSSSMILSQKQMHVPKVLYKNAIHSIPDSIHFRLKFLDLCDQFPLTQSLKQEVINSIEHDFGKDVDGWMARAHYIVKREGTHALDNLQSCNERNSKRLKTEGKEILVLLENATLAVQSPRMFLETVKFIRCYMKKIENDQMSKNDPFSIFLISLFEKAKQAKILTPELLLENVRFLLDAEEEENAYFLLEHYMEHDTLCRNSAQCWMKWSEVSNTLGNYCSSKPIKNSFEILRSALETIPVYAKDHWIVSSRLFQNLLLESPTSTHQKKEIISLFKKLIFFSNNAITFSEKDQYSSQISMIELSFIFLQYEVMNGNIKSIRDIYTEIFNSNNFKSCEIVNTEDVKKMKIFIDACICAEKIHSGEGKVDLHLQTHQFKKIYGFATNFFTGSWINLADSYRLQQCKLLESIV